MEDKNVDRIAGVVWTLQIIVPALAGGLLVFTLVAFFVQRGQAKPGNAAVFLSLSGAAFAVAAIFARFLVPALMVRSGCQRIARGVRDPSAVWTAEQALRSTDSEQLLAVFSAKTIVSGAILESAGFFNPIAYITEGQGYSLVLALILLVGILIGIPTRRGLESWLEQQQRRIQEIRDVAGLR
jgi:hypothetical protein